MACVAGAGGVATAQRVVELASADAAARMAAIESAWDLPGGWPTRAHHVRDHLLTTLDLPTLSPGARAGAGVAERGPLDATTHASRALAGYVVENVSFRAFDGSRVAGNLYRPAERAEARGPAVLCPHGHFGARGDDPEGRFRRDMQLRCATLARLGAVVFAWDMVAWGESDIADHDVPDALALQTYNSVRAVDYLLSRDEVDPSRIAVTGASGGGSQTFLLAAIDERVGASVPVVMVSSHFFGGCNCETGLPLHWGESFATNNVEIAALAAPRPLLLISDGQDWTKHTPEIEFPTIRRVYAALGMPGQVQFTHIALEGHDYGPSKRGPMYAFLADAFGLDLTRVSDSAGRIDESPVTILPREDLLCYPAAPRERRPAREALAALRAGA